MKLLDNIISGIVNTLYISNSLDSDHLTKECTKSLMEGNCLIIFPEGSRTSRGTAIINLLQLQPEERKLARLTDRVINKLKGMDDEAFQQLDLYPE